ncbi:hypothetical protein KCP71_19050 [Salmonella enterica subsp. enterica]|nr:hypothetical protein KCP71_19050 [Salmonella enterica subsp. enterica]
MKTEEKMTVRDEITLLKIRINPRIRMCWRRQGCRAGPNTGFGMRQWPQ